MNLVYWLVHDGELFEKHRELILPTRVDRPEFDEKQLTFGRGSIRNIWPEDVKIFVIGSQSVDLLLCTPHINIVSDRAREVIQNLAPDDVEFLPVKVFGQNGKEYNQMAYWAIYVLRVVDPLDWVHTKWTTPFSPSKDDPSAYMKIIKPCFFADKIRDINFFRLEVGGKIRGSMYISSVLADAVTTSGCSVGMEFTPIKTI